MQACWKTEENLPCINLCMRDNMMSSSQKGTTEVDHGVYYQHFGEFFCSMFQIFALMLNNNAGTVCICEYFLCQYDKQPDEDAAGLNTAFIKKWELVNFSVQTASSLSCTCTQLWLDVHTICLFLLLVWRNNFVTFSVYLTELTDWRTTFTFQGTSIT